MITVRKRKLHDDRADREYWAKASHKERLHAVQVINRLEDPTYAEQAFPRIHRITRRAER
jgi:hypothetical protein